MSTQNLIIAYKKVVSVLIVRLLPSFVSESIRRISVTCGILCLR